MCKGTRFWEVGGDTNFRAWWAKFPENMSLQPHVFLNAVEGFDAHRLRGQGKQEGVIIARLDRRGCMLFPLVFDEAPPLGGSLLIAHHDGPFDLAKLGKGFAKQLVGHQRAKTPDPNRRIVQCPLHPDDASFERLGVKCLCGCFSSLDRVHSDERKRFRCVQENFGDFPMFGKQFPQIFLRRVSMQASNKDAHCAQIPLLAWGVRGHR